MNFLYETFRQYKLAGLQVTATVPVKGQKARATGCRFYTERLAAQPYFIGGHFFQYLYEPVTGRFDRDAAFNGFVNVAGIPSPDTGRAARASHAPIYRLHAGKLKPFGRSPEVQA